MIELCRVVRVTQPKNSIEETYDWVINRVHHARILRGHAVNRDTKEVIPGVVRFLDSKKFN